MSGYPEKITIRIDSKKSVDQVLRANIERNIDDLLIDEHGYKIYGSGIDLVHEEREIILRHE